MKSGYSFFYVFFTALAVVLIDKINTHVPILISLAITSGIALIFFTLVNFKQLVTIYKINRKFWLFSLLMNLCVLVNWFFSYLGVSTSSATFFVFIYFLVQALIVLLVARLAIKNLLKASLIVISIIVATLYIERHQVSYLGILYGFIAAGAGYAYMLFSHRLSKQGELSATQILATRFCLLFTISLVLSLSVHFSNYHLLTHHQLDIIIIIAFASLIVPLYFSQRALAHIGLSRHTFIRSLTPLFTYALQGIILGEWSYGLLIFSILTPIIINIDFILAFFKKKISA